MKKYIPYILMVLVIIIIGIVAWKFGSPAKPAHAPASAPEKPRVNIQGLVDGATKLLKKKKNQTDNNRRKATKEAAVAAAVEHESGHGIQ